MALVALVSVEPITSTQIANRDVLFNLVQIDETNYNVTGLKKFATVDDAINVVVSGNAQPLNFSVVQANGAYTIKDDKGSFKRFNKLGSAVVVAKIALGRGKHAFRLLSCVTGTTVDMTESEIIARAQQQEASKQPFLQNGIIRDGAICSYPNAPYPTLNQNKSEYSAGSYDPVKIIAGTEKAPREKMQAEYLGNLSNKMVGLLNEALKSDMSANGKYTKQSYDKLGRAVAWVVKIPEFEFARYCFTILRDNVKDFRAFVFDDKFDKVCPELMQFISKYSDVLVRL